MTNDELNLVNRYDIALLFLLLLICAAFFIGMRVGVTAQLKEAQIYSRVITDLNLKAQEKDAYYLVELELAKIRADIYKRQAQNLLNANAGLKTIIKGSPKLRGLIK